MRPLGFYCQYSLSLHVTVLNARSFGPEARPSKEMTMTPAGPVVVLHILTPVSLHLMLAQMSAMRGLLICVCGGAYGVA